MSIHLIASLAHSIHLYQNISASSGCFIWHRGRHEILTKKPQLQELISLLNLVAIWQQPPQSLATDLFNTRNRTTTSSINVNRTLPFILPPWAAWSNAWLCRELATLGQVRRPFSQGPPGCHAAFSDSAVQRLYDEASGYPEAWEVEQGMDLPVSVSPSQLDFYVDEKGGDTQVLSLFNVSEKTVYFQCSTHTQQLPKQDRNNGWILSGHVPLVMFVVLACVVALLLPLEGSHDASSHPLFAYFSLSHEIKLVTAYILDYSGTYVAASGNARMFDGKCMMPTRFAACQLIDGRRSARRYHCQCFAVI
ncbi:uncharacterized protein LOC119160728 isoform X5 [Rhipicephalus microplus]|uniref:uncharacterized protein LOC119160728 isoform X5 n=1 Tax=Rhipicephalus microplus TaxID=6941 RepID=UPI003F6D31F1